MGVKTLKIKGVRMKKIKSIFFLLLIIMISPLFASACGELKFEDVPYTSTNETVEVVVEKLNDSRLLMVDLDLKMKIKTTNIYTFYQTGDNKVVSKKIKDVITSNIGVEENGVQTTAVDVVRYQDDVKLFQLTNTFVSKKEHNEEVSAYCYTQIKIFSTDEEFSQKSRTEYNSGYYNTLKFFNDAYVKVEQQEIDNVTKKNFEGVDYYKLSANLNGLSEIRDRFTKNENLQNDPMLFTSLNPSYDTILSCFYEYGINSSNYMTYARLNYTIASNDNIYNERYLNVDSVSRLIEFGQNLKSAQEPEDKDDYTVESFLSNIIFGNNKFVYKNSLGENFIRTTIISKDITNQNNFILKTIYNIKVETFGETPDVKNYLIEYDYKEYKAYLINEGLKQYQECQMPISIMSLSSSNLQFISKDKDSNDLDVYTYEHSSGQENIAIKVTIKDAEVYSLAIKNGTNEKLLYVEEYTDDLSNISIVESLEGYEKIEVENAEAGE